MGPRRRTTVLAWSLCALWAAIAATALWIGSWSESIFALLVAGYAVVGAMVASRHPDNAIGWLLLAIALSVALHITGQTYLMSFSSVYVTAGWLTGWLFNVWFYLMGAFLPLLFPTGRVLSARWRLVWWFDLVTLVAGAAITALKPGNLAVNVSMKNPIELSGPGRAVVEALNGFVLPAAVLAVVISTASLVLRFHRSIGAERQQLKWFASATLVVVTGFVLSVLESISDAGWVGALSGLGWGLFLFGAVLAIPAATGIAILRYRLFEIDVVINRTLVYGTLTAALAATYVVSILLLRALLNPFTGKSDLAVAVSTLAVAALFRPARARIQDLVNRRFYRRRYDAVQTLEEFSARLRHELDLDAVGADLRTTADRTMQPAHVSLWLRAR